MSQKERKFRVCYLVTFSGLSRGADGKQTFQEEIIENSLKEFLNSFSNMISRRTKTELRKTDKYIESLATRVRINDDYKI